MFLNFNKIKNFIFDLDGTVWKWTSLLPNVRYVINKLEEKDKKVYYVSNNAVLSRNDLAQKLTKLGIPTNKDQMINSGYAAARYFADRDIKEVYVIGESGLIDELAASNVSASNKAKHILISTDRNFTYWKIKKTQELAKNGAELYSVGHAPVWYVGEELYPGEDPLVKAIENATFKTATLLGKPSDNMKKVLLKNIHVFGEQTLFVGDSLSSDIVFGHKCAFRTALVLTGDTSLEKAKAAKGLEKPDYIIKDIRALLM